MDRIADTANKARPFIFMFVLLCGLFAGVTYALKGTHENRDNPLVVHGAQIRWYIALVVGCVLLPVGLYALARPA